MNKHLLSILALFLFMALPAYAALSGTDTKPGDACTAGESGYTRRNASATQDPREITLICNGSVWVSAGSLKGIDDTGPCTAAKDGLIKYSSSATPPWQYCDGGTTSWLPFRLPQCQNDGTGACTLSALRSSDDPQFKAASIRCGDNIMGVVGSYGSGSSNAFNYTDVTNAAFSTLTTASAVTISGIPAGCPGEVYVLGQGSPEISINGGAWVTNGTINNGQTLAVRLTSSGTSNTTYTATISIGSTDESWSVTTTSADTIPNAFTFTDLTNQALSTLISSNTITIGGINASTPVSVTGTGAEISINGGAWGTTGNITNGQTLQVRLTSSASFSTAMTATVNVGGVTDTWSVTTRGPNTCTAQSKTWLTNCTATVSAAAHNGSGTATITDPGGCGTTYYGSATFSCSDGAFSYSSGTCTQQTACDTTPNAFTFTDQSNVNVSTLISSNTATINGINTSTPVSVTGASTEISINGGAWGTTGNITSGQTLQVRLTSSASYMTAASVTITVGTVTVPWVVTTMPAPAVYTTPGTYTYTVPSGATGIVMEAFGAGGSGGDWAGGGGGGGSYIQRDSNSTVMIAAGGGGGGGGPDLSDDGGGGGGGGYAKGQLSAANGATAGATFTVIVGGGGVSVTQCSNPGGGGPGGAVGGGASGPGNFIGNATAGGAATAASGGGGGGGAGGGKGGKGGNASTYGGGGGGGGGGLNAGGAGGNATYGGAGGGGWGSGANDGACGTSTYGGPCTGTGTGPGGGGGGAFLHANLTSTSTTNGSPGTLLTPGTAAHSGPGNGVFTCGSNGGNGKVVITIVP